MGQFKSISICSKLQFSLMGFSILTLLVCIGSLTLLGDHYFHQKMRQDLEMLAAIVADNSGAALAFEDEEAATNVLASLRSNTSISAAVLFKENADPLAYYPDAQAAFGLDNLIKRNGVEQSGAYYFTSVPVKLNQRLIGQLVMKSDLSDLALFKKQLQRLTVILILALIILTGLISRWLKRHFTQPLASLSEWAVQVSKHKNFNAHALKKSDDEIGHLVDSLNLMLSELAKQETILSLNRELEREIQERKKIESDLIATRDRAEEASKAKSQFLANMSHELRTPLNAIIGYSEMMQEMVEDGDVDVDVFVGDIDKVRLAGKHLLSLINDILDISKIEAGKMQVSIEAFNIEALMHEVVDAFRPLAAQKHNQLRVRSEGGLGVIRSDMVKVRQILFNLMSNAIKFTSQGEVELSCQLEQTASGEWVRCTVRDTGIGISQQALKELFQPFSQVDLTTTRQFGGTGLGLAITRSFVTMLGGEVSVNSRLGEGSEFSVRLPVSIQAEADVKMPLNQPDHRLRVSGSTQVLIIDDDIAVHEILQHQLEPHGFEVTTALNGYNGLQIAKTGSFDLIVLDIVMPDMDGWQVLTLLKNNPITKSIPVVLYTIDSSREKGFSLGASDYFVKPISGDNLLRVLRRYQRRPPPNKLLYIDDDPQCQELMRTYLSRSPWQLVSAANGVEGIEMLRKHADIALILLDVIMPEMNGFEFLEAMSHMNQPEEVPVIVVSAKDLSTQERDLLMNYSQSIIQKGLYDKSILLEQIEKVLSEKWLHAEIKDAAS